MKSIKIFFFVLLIAAVLTASKERPVHIFMAGDSTMALKPLAKMVLDSISGDSISEPFPERGWGQVLPLCAEWAQFQNFYRARMVAENTGWSASRRLCGDSVRT